MDYIKQGKAGSRRIAYIGGALCLSIIVSFIAAAAIMLGAEFLNTEVSRPTLRFALFVSWLVVTLITYAYVQSLCLIPAISIAIGMFSRSMQQRYGQFMQRTIGKWRPYRALCRAL